MQQNIVVSCTEQSHFFTHAWLVFFSLQKAVARNVHGTVG
jgi:hypothetical protein